MSRYMDIDCATKLTVFFELPPRKTARFLETVYADKSLRQMKTIVCY